MLAYVIKRLWQMVPTLFGVVLLVFLLFHFFGSDPSVILAGQNSTPEQIAAIRQQLGLMPPDGSPFAGPGRAARNPNLEAQVAAWRAAGLLQEAQQA